MHTLIINKKVKSILFVLSLLFSQMAYGIALDTVYCDTNVEIFAAFKNAQAGDRIVISSGVYYGNDSMSGNSKGAFWCGADGTQRYPIYVECTDTAGSVTFMGESIEQDYALYITGDCWIFDGIEIKTGKKGVMIDNANNTVLKNCSVHEIGQEGIHVRDGSQYCTIENCYIYDTGLVTPGFGEGIYVGSAKSHWDDFATDEHYTIIRNCIIGPDVRAELIDIKEATVGTLIEYNTFNGTGITGEHYADSFIDAKGNNALIQYNVGYRNNNTNIIDAFQTHLNESVWGFDNVFLGNEIYMDNTTGYVVNSASGSAKVLNNNRYPEGNMYRGSISDFINELPTVSLVSPFADQQYQYGEMIYFSANASDDDGNISFVDFYLDGELVNKDIEAPFIFELNDIRVGEHELYVITYDNVMQWSDTDTIQFVVEAENDKYEKIAIKAVEASGSDANVPVNAIDGDLMTRWSKSGDNQWIQFDLESFCFVSHINIAFYKGHQRRSIFDLQISNDGENWKEVLTGIESSGTSEDFQLFNFEDDSCRYVRYMGHGNSYNSWNSIYEFEVYGYSIRQMSIENSQAGPQTFTLNQNYPNPFNPSTNISFELYKISEVKLDIINLQGTIVETLVDDRYPTGFYNINWNAASFESGVYFCRLTADRKSETLKMILIK